MAKSRAGASLLLPSEMGGKSVTPSPCKSIHHGEKEYVYLEEGSFSSWQVNPLKGIPGGSAFAWAEFGSSCCWLSSVGWGWDMEGEDQIPPGSGSMCFSCRAVAV